MKKRAEQVGSRKGERGSILALSSIAMLAVLLAVGMGVDISRFYLSKAELQNAADAAALAGVSGLTGFAPGINDATTRAVQTVNNYEFNHTGLTITPDNVQFAVNLNGPYMNSTAAASSPTNIRFVKVTTPEVPVGVSFAAFLLGSSKDMAATATAGKSVPLNDICPWLPAFVMDYPDKPITPGNTYTFRLSPSNFVSPGNYQLLAPIQSGGSGDREGMANGVDWCISPGQEVRTKPGGTAGAIRQGINTRFDEYGAGLSHTTSPPDANIAENINYSQYSKNEVFKAPNPSHGKGIAGRRVVFIPIAKTLPGEGRDTIVVDRFGVFFLKSKVGNGNGGELQAEYITTTIFAANSSYDPGAGATNSLMTVPVLYK